MTLHYTDDRVTLYHGDCIEVMRTLPDSSVDAVVTDPPYGLEFMGKEWDSFTTQKTTSQSLSPSMAKSSTPKHKIRGKKFEQDWGQHAFQEWFTTWATEALRVLKPGGHLLAFGGTRTWHRLAVAIEDAGFEIRDSIAWHYGSGFPKSLDVSKAIDKAAGAQREVLDSYQRAGRSGGILGAETLITRDITAPATPAAQQWQGWGTALKPAHEPIVVARKPLIGTVAANVLTHGTGALNIDGCRIAGWWKPVGPSEKGGKSGGIMGKPVAGKGGEPHTAGRWPANVILDESQAAELDAQSGVTTSTKRNGERTGKESGTFGSFAGQSDVVMGHNDSGGASRFFYVAKASKKERPNVNGVAHPTVKPMALMQYLVRLVTPPGGTVLEPFAGSGTTIEAALNEGFNVIGIEMTDEYLPLIMSRIERYGDKLC